MIVGVAFCPQAPVLVPDLAGGAAPELDEVRAACRTAIRRVAVDGATPVLVGVGAAARAFESGSTGTLAGFGLPLVVPLGTVDALEPPTLPPSLTVGAWLVRDALGPGSGALALSVAPGEPAALDTEAPVALVVLGDGTARRTEKAPGHLDPRAVEFDASIAAALGGGDPDALRLDATPAAELLVSGAPAWAVAADALAGHDWDAELLCETAPYGVEYLVAAWTPR